jgi:glycosyltransferase involved in cell wall biosynthesis
MDKPLVSICITHYNQPRFLAQTLRAIEAQDYPNFEVILVDDGSTNPYAIEYLKHIESQFSEKGWKIIHQKNMYLGAARNSAAAKAKGEYLMFMDDDNYAHPTQVSTFIQAALHSDADILTCFNYFFYSISEPKVENRGKVSYLPLGSATYSGFFGNCFGDANALFKRNAFEKLGGFVEDRDHSMQDWDIMARATISKMKVYTIPRPLLWYRVRNNSMFRTKPFTISLRTLINNYARTNSEYLVPILEYVLSPQVKDSDQYQISNRLSVSPDRDICQKINSIDPNSDEAYTLLIELAAKRGRSELALELAAELKSKDSNVAQVIVESLQKSLSSPKNLKSRVDRDLNRLELSISKDIYYSAELLTPGDFSFSILNARPTGLFLHPQQDKPSIVLLHQACPANATRISATVLVENPRGPHVQFGILVANMEKRAKILTYQSFEELCNLGDWSGWHLVQKVKHPEQMSVNITNPKSEPKDIFLMTSVPDGGSIDYAHAIFQNVKVFRDRPIPPAQSLAVKEKHWFSFNDEIRNYGLLPVIDLSQEIGFSYCHFIDTGLYMHPVKGRLNVAIIQGFYPSEASYIKAFVSLNHELANPIQFGIWVMPSSNHCENWEDRVELIGWLSDGFSGWQTVKSRKESTSLEIPYVKAADHYEPRDLFIATRIPPDGKMDYCHALWHSIEVGIL